MAECNNTLRRNGAQSWPRTCAKCKLGPCTDYYTAPAAQLTVTGPITTHAGVQTWDGLKPNERGDWMQTYTGGAFYPLDPRPEDLRIEDIGSALSMLCRYGGHTRYFYSVAEHCVHVASKAPKGLELTALMHDASEAYLSDVIRPIKPFLSNYAEIEQRLERAIAQRFGLIYPLPSEIKALDNAILNDEREQAMARPPQEWRGDKTPLGVTLQFWTPAKARYEFGCAFYRYGGR